jgi:tetratricopeptide (TPR) repeat protein
MRAAVLFLLFATCSVWPSYAGPCAGAEAQLARVSRELTLDATDVAEAMLRPIALSHPECPEILLAQARIQDARGNADQAADLYIRYTDLEPDKSQGFAYFGRFFLEHGDYMRADAVSAAAVDKDPNDPAALALRGQILVMKAESAEGKALLEKACRLDPDDPEAQFQLGAIYDRAKSAPNAVQHFRKAATLNPRDSRAWDYLALNLEPMGDLNGAEQAYRKGLQVNEPGRYHDAFLDFNYGRFLAKKNDLAASKEHMDRAVELAPQVRAVWYERAKLNLRLKNYPQARSDAEKAASCADPSHVIIDLQIYALLAQVYGRLGETGLAKKYANLSRETEPPVRGEYR